jgi:prepilin-type N-terminal cleavage/methylation domain-containing protein
MKNKNGFTLAEVLITLAIIGVVAALTIPSVVKNYQKTQTTAKLRKAWSAINQAYNMSQAQNGMYQTWDNAEDIGSEEYFNRYWKPYLKVSKICTTYSDCGYKESTPWDYSGGGDYPLVLTSSSARMTFLTPDGILFLILATSGGTVDNNIITDLNGSKEPNVLGKDVFHFIRTNKGILPQCHNSTIANININSSKNGTGTCCAAKIARDGWEIKDDYPW